MLAALMAASMAWSQSPFGLDPSFETDMNSWYVSSVLPLMDRKVIVSGSMRFPGFTNDKLLARLDHQGTLDTIFYASSLGGGKLIPWNWMYYVGTSQTVRRILPTGYLDPDWTEMNLGLYFSSLQGGDYHVFPGGHLLMSGAHILSDSIRGFEGLYNLIWFSNEGYLDTTRIHRQGNGVVYEFEQLFDGGFICTSNCSQFDGQPTDGWIFKVDSTGAIDTTFQSGVYWGEADAFLPLPDGRCYAGGLFKITGIPDTLHLVRFMPDGSLDPSFNHLLDFRAGSLTAPQGASVLDIHPLDDARLIITGEFENIEGEPRQAICLVDSSGNLINDYFTGPGCDEYTYMGSVLGALNGIAPAPDGSWYIYGGYHGYDDGTANYPGQRMVSRLYGLDVGVQEQRPMVGGSLSVHPNPASTWVAFDHDLKVASSSAALVIRDVAGREVGRYALGSIQGQTIWDSRRTEPGVYTIELMNNEQMVRAVKLIIRQ